MKYLITESQAKIAATFHKLDMKKFIQIEMDGRIYFVKSKDDEYAQIRYFTDNGWCLISVNLINEISSWFSLDETDSKTYIAKWVENTLQMEVTTIYSGHLSNIVSLRIPSE
jgi:hypothetical protein